jgi:hypothetical protein
MYREGLLTVMFIMAVVSMVALMTSLSMVFIMASQELDFDVHDGLDDCEICCVFDY